MVYELFSPALPACWMKRDTACPANATDAPLSGESLCVLGRFWPYQNLCVQCWKKLNLPLASFTERFSCV